MSLATAAPRGHPWAPSSPARTVVRQAPRDTSVIKAPAWHPAPSPPAFLAPPTPAHSLPSSAPSPCPACGPRAQPCPGPPCLSPSQERGPHQARGCGTGGPMGCTRAVSAGAGGSGTGG